MSDHTAPASHRSAGSRRRGATLVLVAVAMSVLCAFAGVGVDIARMYSFVAQLKTGADAAALSAADLRKRGTDSATAYQRTLALRGNNRINGADSIAMTAANIRPGTWNFNTRTFTVAPGGWSDTLVNAVRVTATYTANWTLARLFGVVNKTLTQTSVAAIGSQATASCLKPFAMPYTAILTKLGKPINNLAYNLTANDIVALGVPSADIDFNESTANNMPPGSFGLLEFSNGASAQAVANSISGCTYTGNGVGTNISVATGNKWNANAVRTALSNLCGPNAPTCDATRAPILVPIFDQATGNGANAVVRVKYIGAFKLTSYTNGALRGYLTSLSAAGGGFSSNPGPAQMTVLVQ